MRKINVCHDFETYLVSVFIYIAYVSSFEVIHSVRFDVVAYSDPRKYHGLQIVVIPTTPHRFFVYMCHLIRENQLFRLKLSQMGVLSLCVDDRLSLGFSFSRNVLMIMR